MVAIQREKIQKYDEDLAAEQEKNRLLTIELEKIKQLNQNGSEEQT